MNFRDAMEHYRAGTASEEERQMVEQELEKMRLLEEYLDDRWDDSSESSGFCAADGVREGAGEDAGKSEGDLESAAAELKSVRRSLRRRTVRIVLISLAVTAAVLLTVFYVAVPAAEKQYMDPETNSFGGDFNTDLELALAAYSELFVPDNSILSMKSTHTGFAEYELEIQYFNPAKWYENKYASGHLKKNVLGLPAEILMTCSPNIFERGCFGFDGFSEEQRSAIRKRLSQLPEYVKVYAAVSFPEDLTMEELVDFSDNLQDGTVGWVGIRHVEEDRQMLPLCGMQLFANGVVREGINDDYPMFEIKLSQWTGDDFRQHFQSLLKYLADWSDEDKEIGVNMGPYCESVLAYVEENGVYSYGCYLTASPQTILNLLDSGEITQVYMEDAWLDF